MLGEAAAAHPVLRLVGLVGSIDNDMFGTDMTMGADTALHRIVEALDAIDSTASSHQRTFVVEVMGRHCGYLALMAALAPARTGLDPEPAGEGRVAPAMCAAMRAGRAGGRRRNLVLVAEKARDLDGNPISVAVDAKRVGGAGNHVVAPKRSRDLSFDLLWSTAAVAVVFGALLHCWLYARGFSKAQESGERWARWNHRPRRSSRRSGSSAASWCSRRCGCFSATRRNGRSSFS